MNNAIKPFLSYDEQISKLTEEKGLMITDKEVSKELLADISYYALIDGYKNPFYNQMTRKYVAGATFTDIVALYKFDEALRNLIFQYICIIEQKMRSYISYYFTETYSNLQQDYLNPNNFANTKHNKADILKLIKTLNYAANSDKKHNYIVYQRNKYGNVPLWVLMKVLTIGQTSKMYSLLLPAVKAKVAHHFKFVTEKELIQFMKVLTDYRNVCAHNERLYCHRDRYEIPDTALHVKMGLDMKGNHYIQGKSDVLSVVIAFRYLLSDSDFIEFKHRLTICIKKTVKNASSLEEEKLLNEMGFPNNWKNITRYQLK